MRFFNPYFLWWANLSDNSKVKLILFLPTVALIYATGLTVGFD